MWWIFLSKRIETLFLTVYTYIEVFMELKTKLFWQHFHFIPQLFITFSAVCVVFKFISLLSFVPDIAKIIEFSLESSSALKFQSCKINEKMDWIKVQSRTLELEVAIMTHLHCCSVTWHESIGSGIKMFLLYCSSIGDL